MKKFTQIGMLVIASLFISAIAFSQSNSTVADVATEVSFRPDQMSPPAPIPPKSAKGILFENGPVVTDVGGGPGGADFSFTEAPLTLYGWGVQFGVGNRLSDDFEVTDGPWSVDSIIVWAYQTNSGNTSTITGFYVQIWDGSPDDPGSTVIWGDVVTEVMDNTYWSNCYRGDDYGSSARPIMRVVTVPSSLTLNNGTYWIDYTIDGSGSSGPWGPPVTILGQTDTGDGLQLISTGWGPALNNGYPNGVPFEIWGPTAALEPIIEWTPVELIAALSIDETETQTITISNVGLADLDWDIAILYASGTGWLSADPTVGTVAPGGSMDVDVTFNSAGLANDIYEATVYISSNDPVTQVAQVPAILDVITGIKENSKIDLQISSYNDQLIIKANMPILSTKIYNQLGQVITNTTATQINTSSFKSGIYFIRVTTNNGEAVRKVFIN